MKDIEIERKLETKGRRKDVGISGKEGKRSENKEKESKR